MEGTEAHLAIWGIEVLGLATPLPHLIIGAMRLADFNFPKWNLTIFGNKVSAQNHYTAYCWISCDRGERGLCPHVKSAF